MPSFLVLTNPQAGGADDDVLDAVLAVLRAGGADVDTAPLGLPDELAETLGRFPGHRPVAAGGDGSLHLLVAALHVRGELGERVLGLVPMGTGNDVAGSLGIPEDPEAAAGVVLHGRVRALDLLTDDEDSVVINAVHLGIGAQANKDGSPLKPLLGRIAYQVGAVVAGLRSTGWRLRVVVDGRVLVDGGRRVLQVGIANGATIGGGTPLSPDAVPDDGLVDVVVSTATGPFARFGYARLFRKGRHGEHPAVTITRAREVRVSGPATPLNVDGEIGELTGERCWTVQPRAWRITVPS